MGHAKVPAIALELLLLVVTNCKLCPGTQQCAVAYQASTLLLQNIHQAWHTSLPLWIGNKLEQFLHCPPNYLGAAYVVSLLLSYSLCHHPFNLQFCSLLPHATLISVSQSVIHAIIHACTVLTARSLGYESIRPASEADFPIPQKPHSIDISHFARHFNKCQVYFDCAI